MRQFARSGIDFVDDVSLGPAHTGHPVDLPASGGFGQFPDVRRLTAAARVKPGAVQHNAGFIHVLDGGLKFLKVAVPVKQQFGHCIFVSNGR